MAQISQNKTGRSAPDSQNKTGWSALVGQNKTVRSAPGSQQIHCLERSGNPVSLFANKSDQQLQKKFKHMSFLVIFHASPGDLIDYFCRIIESIIGI